MKLIIGLGNPGPTYANTRHNIGFMTIDAIATFLGCSLSKISHQGHWTKTLYHGHDIMLLKPQTFMNLSGQSVQSLMHYYHINSDDILVIYDDLDLPLGQLRLREKGSSGGHNGMKSIIQHLNTEAFKRLRIGIGHPGQTDTVNHVLGHFPVEEKELLQSVLKKAKEAATMFIVDDFSKVMNIYNR